MKITGRRSTSVSPLLNCGTRCLIILALTLASTFLFACGGGDGDNTGSHVWSLDGGARWTFENATR